MDRIKYYNEFILGRNNELYDYAPVIAENGDYKRLSGIDVSINAIRNLLLTPLGSYPFDPNYGSLLYKKIFEPLDQISLDEVKFECDTRIKQYIGKVKIEKVDVFSYTPTTSAGKEKGVVVNIHINRNGVQGKVNLVLPTQQGMFGLDDDIYGELFRERWKRKETLNRIKILMERNLSYRALFYQRTQGKAYVSDNEKLVIHPIVCSELGIPA